MAAHYIGGAHHMGDGRVHPAPATMENGNGNGEMPQISKDMALVLVLAQDPNVKIDKGTFLQSMNVDTSVTKKLSLRPLRSSTA